MSQFLHFCIEESADFRENHPFSFLSGMSKAAFPTGEYEIRTFHVGPMTDEEYALLPQGMRSDISRVASGEAHENDDNVNILAPQSRDAIMAVQQEISQFARRYIVSKGITTPQVIAAIDELQRKEMLQAPPDVVRDDARLHRILRETVWQVIYRIELALEEVLTNHLKHGNKDPRKKVGGEYWINPLGELHVESWDSGEGFRPEGVPDPTERDRLEVTNGRGRLLATAFSDGFEDGSNGPTGKLGTSVHQWHRLERLQEVPSHLDECSVLTHYVHTAIGTVLHTEEEERKKAAERERERQQS
jgi:anti-sigma regulatory factor (Ser/Thr protein kinase)